MIQCNSCLELYHLTCEDVEIPERKICHVESYLCRNCNPMEGPQIRYRETAENHFSIPEEILIKHCPICSKLSSRQRKKRRKFVCTHVQEQDPDDDNEDDDAQEEPEVEVYAEDPSNLDFRIGGDMLVLWNSQYFEITVRRVEDNNVLVHYKGWSKGFDEWITKDSGRFAPMGFTEPVQK
eukprot:TRINITY_DN16379_c0_g1_i1.p1 TRINITY_DN16379_c0_g1~~TRINITY_DN16379_c0_g1_i1.p1  ORF type:complete len:180 (-),score=32.61 TRINITY_DN16379_c0_g1_i1:65-604(-)